jgi:hypothetical protein
VRIQQYELGDLTTFFQKKIHVYHALQHQNRLCPPLAENGSSDNQCDLPREWTNQITTGSTILSRLKKQVCIPHLASRQLEKENVHSSAKANHRMGAQ